MKQAPFKGLPAFACNASSELKHTGVSQILTLKSHSPVTPGLREAEATPAPLTSLHLLLPLHRRHQANHRSADLYSQLTSKARHHFCLHFTYQIIKILQPCVFGLP